MFGSTDPFVKPSIRGLLMHYAYHLSKNKGWFTKETLLAYHTSEENMKFIDKLPMKDARRTEMKDRMTTLLTERVH